MADELEASNESSKDRTGLPWGDLVLVWIVGPIIWWIVLYATTAALALIRGGAGVVVAITAVLAASAACAWAAATFVDERPWAAAVPALIVPILSYALLLSAMSRLVTGPQEEVLLLPAAGLVMGLLVIYLVSRRSRGGEADE